MQQKTTSQINWQADSNENQPSENKNVGAETTDLILNFYPFLPDILRISTNKNPNSTKKRKRGKKRKESLVVDGHG